jgi:hypothetical protein
VNNQIAFVRQPRPSDFYQFALSPNNQDISSGAGKGGFRVTVAGTIESFTIAVRPDTKPSVVAIECDLNRIDDSTGAATSVLSAVATIATGGIEGSGTINGTQEVEAGEFLSADVDQGSDGQNLFGIVEIKPS